MISYIFNNKIKNFFVVIFSIILIYINLKELHMYMLFGAWDGIILKLIDLIPYVLIFLYMVTLTREYKIKQFLFPVAFAFFTLSAVFSIGQCFDEYTFTSINGLVSITTSLIVRLAMLVGYILCFIGTLSNFKRITFLRIGLPICIVTISILGLLHYQTTSWIGNEFFSTLVYLSESFHSTLLLLFYISLIVLTITRKTEYIDITPFVEKRKLKKERKKANKLAKENPEEFSPPLIPDGYWQCMGCGEILPEDKTECECGYKR